MVLHLGAGRFNQTHKCTGGKLRRQINNATAALAT